MPGKSAAVTRAEETRTRLVAVARRLFARHGFAATGTEEIVAAAKVTRGALYFHFADKTALFAAVLEKVAQEVAEAIAAAAAGHAPIEALARGTAAYLDAASHASRQRIYLIDGPSVLGTATWHEIENRWSRPLLEAGIAQAFTDPAIDPPALARLLSGAMVEGASWLAVTAGAAPLKARLLAQFDLIFSGLSRA